jgi:protein-L-isoaspartate O-methyltransferase
MTVTAAEARTRLAESLEASGALRTPDWQAAFANVPREVFAPSFSVRTRDGMHTYSADHPDFWSKVYSDDSLITLFDGAGTAISSSSQPSLMARMLEAFNVTKGAKVLEIGTGTGYNTALLCHRLGDTNVVSMDVDPRLTAPARERLLSVGYQPLIVTADGTAGHPDSGPYEGILATCGVDRIPPAWPRQVRPGGAIVTNIGNGIAVLTVNDEGGASGGFQADAAAFMRARPSPEHVAARAPEYTKLVVGGTGTTRTEPLPHHPESPDALLRELVITDSLEIWMHHHDVLSMSLIPTQDTTIHALVHPPSGSWARITPADDHTVEVTHAGPRDLWVERITLLTAWLKAGRPTPGAYQLAVDPSGQHTLRRDEAVWTFG